MAKFSAPDRQAGAVMKRLQGTVLRSVGTVRNYEQALTRLAEHAQAERIEGGLRGMSVAQVITYLEQRGEVVGQKTLDMERQAAQAMLQHVTGQLPPGARLPVVKSEHQQVLTGRAYTAAQVERIAAAQTERNALATQIAHAAGLRAHELLTLRPATERHADDRPASEQKFSARDGIRYTVAGKGGLCREVLVPLALVERLEARRLDAPQTVTDRGVRYEQHYDLAGGHRWSASFSAAAARALGWSSGAHGVRHSYAQERMNELQRRLPRDEALRVVSQELGHFRPEITEVYLR